MSNEALHGSRRSGFPGTLSIPAILTGILGLLPLAVLVIDFWPYLAGGQATQALFSPDETDFDQILFHYSILPRLAMAFLCGAGLALAGAAIQTVLRNPLASPTTLGVGAGVEFALTLFVLLAPASLAMFQEAFALAGGLIALGAVYLIAANRGNATLWLILAGMIVNLLLQSGSQIILLFNEQYLQSIFMWGAGDLAQNGWEDTQFVWPRVLIGMIAILVLSRPLDLLALGDDTASSLGAKVTVLRLLILGLAVFITASVISAAGMIGFVGLAIPAALRIAGLSRSRDLMIYSVFTGGFALVLIDFLVRQFNEFGGDPLPTGAATALFGAPFIIFMLRKARIMPGSQSDDQHSDQQIVSKTALSIALSLSLVIGVVFSLFVSLDGNGFVVLGWQDISLDILIGRAERTFAAMICGAALAVSGTLIQRVGRNPLASPEITGVSSATALAMIMALAIFGFGQRAELMVIGAAGGIASLFVLLALCRKFTHAPHYMLLNGLAMTAILGAIVRIVLTRGGTQTSMLMSWLAGTTYFTNMDEVMIVAAVTGVLLVVAIALRRPLELASLGTDQSVSLGLGISGFQFAMMLLAAILAASATLLVGPLSFVGLMAPHLARVAGYRLSGGHLLGAVLIGVNVMMVAEWLARNMIYPAQLPTGLIAALIGTSYFLILAVRKR
ncbi:MAG: Fe(3+)-hydroxamate ABC transporter permease FhuB [Thalassospira sp.]|uniref:Fe(3+)-hydroxamate ABC transporter permease FhuB n=1 Tax=Thalassospira sp. UBA4513 TaxID=1947675 RepID=UPI000C5803B2|nr:Fe(3+)-hydroxamate ABC transporter permease FhuB [Thalassospira sp. UBA4513]MBE69495.1 Fe(3+)-hydroxamate ABC transporter permease FhuB [Thalassospira sp.]|tara:strand:+ start:67 stop:2088 length:2022 start_codon:yes stop_codon:yes gene_type:complete